MQSDIHQIVLDEIKRINKTKPANQGELLPLVDGNIKELVAVLNDLHANGKIYAKTKIIYKGKNMDPSNIRFLDFGHITANV